MIYSAKTFVCHYLYFIFALGNLYQRINFNIDISKMAIIYKTKELKH